MKLYEFLYADSIHECGYRTVSIHRTKKGAEKAMRKHKRNKLKEFKEFTCKTAIKNINVSNIKFGQFEDWRIRTIEVQE